MNNEMIYIKITVLLIYLKFITCLLCFNCDVRISRRGEVEPGLSVIINIFPVSTVIIAVNYNFHCYSLTMLLLVIILPIIFYITLLSNCCYWCEYLLSIIYCEDSV